MSGSKGWPTVRALIIVPLLTLGCGGVEPPADGPSRTLERALTIPGQKPALTFIAAHPNNFQGRNGRAVTRIVIHDTEGTFWSAVSWFAQANPAQSSAHYIVSSVGGQVVQMVDDADAAFHAGNFEYNLTTIGIEHEGFLSAPRQWFTDEMLSTSAALTCALALKHHIPIDRQHIIGHDQIPNGAIIPEDSPPATDADLSSRPFSFGGLGNHFDPGPGWNWPDYLARVQRCVLQANGGGLTELPAQRAALNADQRLEVFARGLDGAVWHAWETTPGGGFSSFYSLGGTASVSPVVGRNADGRLEVFVAGADRRVWHRWQESAGGWGPDWYPLGELTDVASQLAVANHADGRLALFARRTDGTLWTLSQSSPAAGWGDPWEQLSAVPLTSEPVTGKNADGRLELFALGFDGQLWHAWQASPSGTFSALYPLGGTGLTSAPAVAANADGRLEVFVLGADRTLLHAWQQPGGGWSDFYPLADFRPASGPAVGATSDGRLEVFAQGTAGELRGLYQTAPNGGWTSSPWPLGISSTSAPAVARGPGGLLRVFARREDGTLAIRRQTVDQWLPVEGLVGGIAGF